MEDTPRQEPNKRRRGLRVGLAVGAAAIAGVGGAELAKAHENLNPNERLIRTVNTRSHEMLADARSLIKTNPRLAKRALTTLNKKPVVRYTVTEQLKQPSNGRPWYRRYVAFLNQPETKMIAFGVTDGSKTLNYIEGEHVESFFLFSPKPKPEPGYFASAAAKNSSGNADILTTYVLTATHNEEIDPVTTVEKPISTKRITDIFDSALDTAQSVIDSAKKK